MLEQLWAAFRPKATRHWPGYGMSALARGRNRLVVSCRWHTGALAGHSHRVHDRHSGACPGGPLVA
jgi:hypothetical protein